MISFLGKKKALSNEGKAFKVVFFGCGEVSTKSSLCEIFGLKKRKSKTDLYFFVTQTVGIRD